MNIKTRVFQRNPIISKNGYSEITILKDIVNSLKWNNKTQLRIIGNDKNYGLTTLIKTISGYRIHIPIQMVRDMNISKEDKLLITLQEDNKTLSITKQEDKLNESILIQKITRINRFNMYILIPKNIINSHDINENTILTVRDKDGLYIHQGNFYIVNKMSYYINIVTNLKNHLLLNKGDYVKIHIRDNVFTIEKYQEMI